MFIDFSLLTNHSRDTLYVLMPLQRRCLLDFSVTKVAYKHEVHVCHFSTYRFVNTDRLILCYNSQQNQIWL